MKGKRFGKRRRICSRGDILRLVRRGAKKRGETLYLRTADNGLDYSRLVCSVGRKYGNAVRRNRWKRMIREAFRLQTEVLPQGVDMMAAPSSNRLPRLGEAKAELRRLLS